VFKERGAVQVILVCMLKVNAKEINTLLSKISQIDSVRGAYVKRHLNLNPLTNCFEFDGNRQIIRKFYSKPEK